jgi:UDP-N-acetylglucosamine 4-epimerase
MRIYGLKTIGLRYFNVFGPRQDPNSTYAAVIPKWFSDLLHGEPVYINGDGETTRDFCFVDNVIQANILSACVRNENALGHVYNIAFSEQNTLRQLFYLIRDETSKQNNGVADETEPVYREFRAGDIRFSLADIGKAKKLLGYHPKYSLRDGIGKAAEWYIAKLL